jgi:hypothetical protein
MEKYGGETFMNIGTGFMITIIIVIAVIVILVMQSAGISLPHHRKQKITASLPLGTSNFV